MPLTGSELDLVAVVPTWSVVDAAWFLVYVVATIVWPGRLVRRLLGWTSGIRAERLAQTLLVGIVVHAVAFWLLLITGLGGVGSPIGLVHLGILSLLAAAQVLHDVRRRSAFRSRLAETRRRTSPWEACGYAIVAVLATYYLVRTVPLFDYDGERLRLYGAAHSDKLTSMMPCAGLRYDAPADNLRFAGYKFLSHYFPHIATAALETTVGTPYTAGYWFHWPLLGIAANGLAVLGFARRMLKSYPAGCVALAIFGLWQVTALMKPLDITPALALSAIGCLDRFMRSRRRRWGVAAVLLIGACRATKCSMPRRSWRRSASGVPWASLSTLLVDDRSTSRKSCFPRRRRSRCSHRCERSTSGIPVIGRRSSSTTRSAIHIAATGWRGPGLTTPSVAPWRPCMPGIEIALPPEATMPNRSGPLGFNDSSVARRSASECRYTSCGDSACGPSSASCISGDVVAADCEPARR